MRSGGQAFVGEQATAYGTEAVKHLTRYTAQAESAMDSSLEKCGPIMFEWLDVAACLMGGIRTHSK